MHGNTHTIVPELLKDRFSLAFKHYQVIIFHAPCGCGKTTVAKELLKQYKTCYLNASDDHFSLEQMDDDSKVLILDDLHLLECETQRSVLCEKIRTQKSRRFILLTRGTIPAWLMSFRFCGIMEDFSMNDLLFDKSSIQALMESYNITLSPAQLSALHHDTKGYPVAVFFLARLVQEKNGYSEAILSEGKRELFLYFDEMVYNRFPIATRNLLVRVAPFEPFNAELAMMISGNKHSGAIVAQIQQDTSMLTSGAPDVLSFHPIFRGFLMWKFNQVLDAHEQESLFSRAGLYYELHEQMKPALDCYDRIGDRHKISELLVKNAELHVGIGQYLEMEKYYFSMPKEEVLKSPTLMAGMSMICSLIMDYEQSEQWYIALQEFTKGLKKTDSQYDDAKGRLAYLDIALPQRGSKGLTTIISATLEFYKSKRLNLPTFSVTSTLPSVINGGKDFCEWAKRDDLFYETMRKPLEGILGRDGVGLADCGICESKFEKDDNYQPRLLTLVSRLTEIQRDGSPDIEFAVVGLLARTYIVKGQSLEALETLKNIRKRFEELGESRFIPNIDAMLCRIQMYRGNMKEVNRWLSDKAPRDDLRIWVMHRYLYMTKAMAQIANGECNNALLILVRLLPYTEKCHRTMDKIYVHVLIAICYYRTKNEDWKQELCKAIDLTYDHRFIRPVADYGVAILPLLNDCGWSKDKKYLEKLIAATRLQAVNYPLYLKEETKLLKPLTATEQQVLKLLCHNMSNQEICDILGIKLATTKSHVSQILQKLDVSRRSEAKEAAEQLGLGKEFKWN